MNSIPEEVSIREVEARLDDIVQNRAVLQLPTGLHLTGMCDLARVFQIVSTWAGRSYDGAIYVDVNKGNSENFLKSSYAFLSTNYCKKFDFSDGSSFSRKEAFDITRDYYVSRYSKDVNDVIDENFALIINIDNANSLRSHPLFYNDRGDLRSRKEFSVFVDSIIEKMLFEKNVDSLVMENLHCISTFVYEAFQNTHDHAIDDIEGKNIKRSVRGVCFEYKEVSEKDLLDDAGENVGLINYFNHWFLNNESNRVAKYLSVSVFDAGDGISSTLLSSRDGLSREEILDLDLQRIYESINSALKIGVSSKSNSSRGNGMSKIISSIKRVGGLLSLRTESMSLVKYFSLADDSDASDRDFVFHDIERYHGLQRHSRVIGTVVSAMIPLNKGRANGQ